MTDALTDGSVDAGSRGRGGAAMAALRPACCGMPAARSRPASCGRVEPRAVADASGADGKDQAGRTGCAALRVVEARCRAASGARAAGSSSGLGEALQSALAGFRGSRADGGRSAGRGLSRRRTRTRGVPAGLGRAESGPARRRGDVGQRIRRARAEAGWREGEGQIAPGVARAVFLCCWASGGV
jgi:hypothetical protein